MQDDPSQPNINSWLEDELFQEYKHDRKAIDATWTTVLEGNGHTAAPAGKAAVAEPPRFSADQPRALAVRTSGVPAVAIAEGDQLIPLRGPALRIAENMAASLTIPFATSQRVMPVKVIDENRRLINQHRSVTGQSKLSYTHLVAWAIVRAIEAVPAVNQAYSERGEESFRVTRGHVNLGIAVDVAGKDGSRSLKVPSIKRAEGMNFAEFAAAYDDL